MNDRRLSMFLDHNSTTPVRPEALEELLRFSSPEYGNPSSLHGAGRLARAAIEDCRARLAARLGARSGEILFTSGGTESNRIALLGCLAAAVRSGSGRTHAVVSSIEHPSVLDLCGQMEEAGLLEVSRIPAGEDGRVDPAAAAAAIRPETALVILQHSNNETGSIQEVPVLASACRARGIPLHSDAVQSLGKIPLRFDDLGADLVAVSGHKVGGPKGAGALWIREGCRFAAPHRGGPQERGIRPGTESLPAIAGFVRAVEVLRLPEPDLRDRLWAAIRDGIPGALRNGGPAHLLPNTLNVSFPGIAAELLLIRLDLDGVAASSGSACSSGAREPSHVLRAMGLSGERTESAVRFSLGWTTTRETVDRAAAVIAAAVGRIRRRSKP